MSEQIRGFIHDRYMQAAAAVGAAVLLVSACTTTSATSSGSGHNRPPSATSTREAGSGHQTASPSPAPLSESAQFDSAYTFLTNFDGTDITGPVKVPTNITNPIIRRDTLRAAELAIASDAVDNDTTWPYDPATLRGVSFIREADVKANALQGLVDNTYADILNNFSNGETSGIGPEISFLTSLLGQVEPEHAKAIEASVKEDEALSIRMQAESTTDTSQWSNDNDALLTAYGDANDTAETFSNTLYSEAGAALSEIEANSPKAKSNNAEENKQQYDYWHQCDGLPEPKASECAADQAISDAQSEYLDLYTQWAAKVHIPQQIARIQLAATNEALADISSGYPELAQNWLTVISIAADRMRVERALAIAGYPSS